MYPHRIRLRGPWQREPLERGAGDNPVGPNSALLPNLTSRVRFRRRFGYPGRIDGYERVWLTFAGIEGSAEVRLNGRPLGRFEGTAGPAEFEVTSFLSSRNELVVEVESGGAVATCGDIALEVRCTAYLRNVRFQWLADGDSLRLHVTGEVVGTCGRPLELYALVRRSTVAYATIEAMPAGQAFELVGEPTPRERDCEVPVSVDLVNGACVWFTVDEWLEDPRHSSLGTRQGPSQRSGEA
jgi:hypothetical protein